MNSQNNKTTDYLKDTPEKTENKSEEMKNISKKIKESSEEIKEASKEIKESSKEIKESSKKIDHSSKVMEKLTKKMNELTNEMIVISEKLLKYPGELISILVLIYLICIPIGRIKKESKFEPIDVGLIMITIIVTSGTLKNMTENMTEFSIGKNGFAAKIKTDIKEGINVQNEKDFKAIKYIDLQLSDNSPNKGEKELFSIISDASMMTYEYINQKAKDTRHRVMKDTNTEEFVKLRKLEGIITIYQVLTKLKDVNEFPRYHEQLGYSLKDYVLLQNKNNRDLSKLSEAKDSLDKAIILYEQEYYRKALCSLNWLECVVHLEKTDVSKSQDILSKIDNVFLVPEFIKKNLNKVYDIISDLEGKYELRIEKYKLQIQEYKALNFNNFIYPSQIDVRVKDRQYSEF